MSVIVQNQLLAKRLKELRTTAGYSQSYIAEVIGVVRQTYSNYERGIRTPDYNSLYILAGLYGISIDDLMHLCVNVNRDEQYEAPSPSAVSKEIADYLDFYNDPYNQKVYRMLNSQEKQMIYCMKQLSKNECNELIQMARLKMALSINHDFKIVY